MILSYLVERATGSIQEEEGSDSLPEKVETIEMKLLSSSPILESFGNAQSEYELFLFLILSAYSSLTLVLL
jgi:myosin heavy subunit